MLKENDHVRILRSGITGIVVDTPQKDTDKYYTVESDEKGVPGGYGAEDSYKLFDCLESDLEVISSG